MAEASLAVQRSSRQFRILQALSQTPDTWYPAPAVSKLVDDLAIGAKIGRGGLHAVLAQLAASGLVDIDTRQKRTQGRDVEKKVYRISPKGQETFVAVEPDAFPWTPGQEVQGSVARYRIRERYRYSGRGLMFVAEIVERPASVTKPDWFAPGHLVMIKTARPVDDAVDDSARYLHVVNQTLEGEWPTLKRLVGQDFIVDTVDWGEAKVRVGRGHTTRALPLRFIVQRRLQGHQHLSAYMLKHRITVDLFWEWGRALAAGLSMVHSLGTVHRDIRPENIVLYRQPSGDLTPVFVDFGEAVFRKVAHPSAAGAHTPPELFTAPEQRGRQIKPSRRADIFSLGAVLYFMATGRAPDFPFADEEALKEAVAQSLRFPGSILYDDFGIADVISRCLCLDPEQRRSSADELLQDLRVRPVRQSDDEILGHVERLRTQMLTLIEQKDEVFKELATVEIQRLNELLDSITVLNRMIIEGPRDTIVRRLSTYIATLRGGSRYLALTVPRFWWPANLGIRSRYFSENIELIRRGVMVQRVLVLTADDRADPLVHEIIRAHLEMEADCAMIRKQHKTAGTVETRFIEVTARERMLIMQTGAQRGIWVNDESAVSLVPAYDSNGVIRAVTLQRSLGPETRNLAGSFDEKFRAPKAKPLRDWAML